LGLLLIGAALFDLWMTGGSTLIGAARVFHDTIVSLRFWR